MPEFGPCVCDIADNRLHEHSDFEPFACGDCDCPGHRTPQRNAAETPSEAHEPRGVPIAANPIDYSQHRLTQAREWADQIITTNTGSFTDPDDPLAVCALADLLELNQPDNADPWMSLALVTRRLIDATNHGQPRRIRDTIRRKGQR